MGIDQTLQVKKYTSTDGTVRYMKDGKLHNWEGPAVIYPDGKEEYFINASYEERIKIIQGYLQGDNL